MQTLDALLRSPHWKDHPFFLTTIRARMAFGICCIENALEKSGIVNAGWQEVFDLLWRFPTAEEIRDLGSWYENEQEGIPYCVLDEVPYKDAHFEYLSEEQYTRFKNLYTEAGAFICGLIDTTAHIGTQCLYGGVRDGAPITLNYLDKLTALMKEHSVPLPDIAFFQQFSYAKDPVTDWPVWGKQISVDVLRQKSGWIR